MVIITITYIIKSLKEGKGAEMDKELLELVKQAVEEDDISTDKYQQIGKVRGGAIYDLGDGEYFVLAEAQVRLAGTRTTFYGGDSIVEGDDVVTAYLEYEVTTHGMDYEPDLELKVVNY